MIGGKYRITRQQGATILSPSLHRDPSVWGDDADAFNPDHFSPEAERARPANAYKPFGTGQRACIGRQFAMQEATLTLGMILQRFELVDHANYVLRIHEMLTQRPEGFTMQVQPRQRAGAVRPHTSMGENSMTTEPTSSALQPIPEPRGRPVVGNLVNVDRDALVQSLMELARHEPEGIFQLSFPGRHMVVVFGADLVDQVCDDERFDKLVQLRSHGNQSIAGDGLFTSWTYEPNWSQGAQHPAAQLQPARHARLPPDDARHRRAADGEVGAPESGRRRRRVQRHDPADARHDRAVRLRLPLQLLLPRGSAPVRRRHDARPERVAGAPDAAARPDAAHDSQAAAVPGRHVLHLRPGRRAHPRAQGESRSGGDQRPARRDAERRRQADRREAGRRQHPLPVHHLPGRRPRDDQRLALVRDLFPAA